MNPVTEWLLNVANDCQKTINAQNLYEEVVFLISKADLHDALVRISHRQMNLTLCFMVLTIEHIHREGTMSRYV